MKKILFIIIPVVVLFSAFVVVAETTTISCTGYETSGPCRPELGSSASNCIANTTVVLNQDAGNNNQAVCQAVVNGQATQILTCTGKETDGPCKPERINEFAAQQKADEWSKKWNTTCVVQKLGFPGVDPTTGLSYYYDVSCPDLKDNNTSSGSSGTSGISVNPGVSGTSSGVSSRTTNTTTSRSTTAQQKAVEAQKQIVSYTKTIMNVYRNDLANFFKSNTTTSDTQEKKLPEIKEVCPNVSTNLKLGDSGSSVAALTKFLVSAGFMTKEQATLNNQVFNAVLKYQEEHKNEILDPVNATKATGFVGPSTRSYINSRIECNEKVVTTNNLPGVDKNYVPGGVKVNSMFLISPQRATVNLGNNFQFTSKYSADGKSESFVDATGGTIWTSDDPSIADFIQNGQYAERTGYHGQVKTLKRGTVMMTGYYKGMTNKATLIIQ